MRYKEKCFTMGLVKYWNRLPREAVSAPSLQTYKARLGGDR